MRLAVRATLFQFARARSGSRTRHGGGAEARGGVGVIGTVISSAISTHGSGRLRKSTAIVPTAKASAVASTPMRDWPYSASIPGGGPSANGPRAALYIDRGLSSPSWNVSQYGHGWKQSSKQGRWMVAVWGGGLTSRPTRNSRGSGGAAGARLQTGPWEPKTHESEGPLECLEWD